jgi:hypothetical protein
MFNTDSPNCGESFADTGEVLDSLVDRGGSGVGASLELGLDFQCLGVLTSNIFYGVIWGTPHRAGYRTNGCPLKSH